MKALKILVLVGIFSYVLATSTSTASEIVHEFKNPSFSGSGYSSHVLSVEQLQANRNKQKKDDAKSAAAAAERAANNTTLAKFIKNVESRIYANLSKQLVDNMFGTTCTDSNCPTSGTAEVEGSTIYWVKDTSTEIITLTITDPQGNVTTMSVPLGDFQF
jgi:Flp pilus assembly protein TadG